MLRIAVPNKGSLAEPAADMLREAGYASRRDGRELVLRDEPNDVEFFFLRPRDVAVYVGSGTLDVGITGRDLLLDARAAADEVMRLDFAGSTFRFAAPPGLVSSVAQVAGRRVATSYAALVEDHLRGHGVEADVVRLDGAVETAVRLGVADVIADVVETGTTLRAAGLESPTVSPLHDQRWAAVRAMVPRHLTNTVMDELYEPGARDPHHDDPRLPDLR